MKFEPINNEAKIHPGEYLLYEPTMQIVICGAFNWDNDFIRCLAQGKLVEDKVSHFKKIKLSRKEYKENQRNRCKGCGA